MPSTMSGAKDRGHARDMPCLPEIAGAGRTGCSANIMGIMLVDCHQLFEPTKKLPFGVGLHPHLHISDPSRCLKVPFKSPSRNEWDSPNSVTGSAKQKIPGVKILCP